MSTHDAILSLLAERDAGRAKLADCKRRERAAVERAEALANASERYTEWHVPECRCILCRAIAADDEARAT